MSDSMKITSFLRNEYWEDWYVQSKENQYLVTIDLVEGTIYCTCPDYQYRKDSASGLKYGGALLSDTDNHCKHMKYVLKIRRCVDNG